MKPHKHAELIKKWADGAEIQCMDVNGKWRTVTPAWDKELKYRIKPEPKPDVVWYVSVCGTKTQNKESALKWMDQCDGVAVHIFDGETGKLKAAEVLK